MGCARPIAESISSSLPCLSIASLSACARAMMASKRKSTLTMQCARKDERTWPNLRQVRMRTCQERDHATTAVPFRGTFLRSRTGFDRQPQDLIPSLARRLANDQASGSCSTKIPERGAGGGRQQATQQSNGCNGCNERASGGRKTGMQDESYLRNQTCSLYTNTESMAV